MFFPDALEIKKILLGDHCKLQSKFCISSKAGGFSDPHSGCNCTNNSFGDLIDWLFYKDYNKSAINLFSVVYAGL